MKKGDMALCIEVGQTSLKVGDIVEILEVTGTGYRVAYNHDIGSQFVKAKRLVPAPKILKAMYGIDEKA